MNLETHSYLYKFLAKTEKKFDNLLVAKQYSLPVSTHMQYYHSVNLQPNNSKGHFIDL